MYRAHDVRNRRIPSLAIAFLITGAASVPALEVDPAIPAYESASGVSGNLNSIGSDTLNNLMTYWAEGFQSIYPNVKIQIEGKGSTTAPPALIAGTSQLGPMSRSMKKEELDAFEKKYGYKPTEVKVAIDALAVFVHKDNPIAKLSLTEVDSIFGSTYKRGGKDITEWGQLGLDAWKGKAVSLYGRNSASGTYGFFKEHALKKGDYKSSVKEQPGSSAVVQGVAADLGGIGYSGIGYVTSSVKALPLSDKGEAAAPNYENCLNGNYPLSRYLFIYVNKKPGQPLDTLTGEFLKYVNSKGGQEVVLKDGFFPMPADVIEKTRASIEK
ncbi:MAG: phosphate ABC transporter substrate-binding protein [Planctomycetes bacterium]|nr:phosphate ABC transporter substrate-binding protein [Planctomycetota bacterium]